MNIAKQSTFRQLLVILFSFLSFASLESVAICEVDLAPVRGLASEIGGEAMDPAKFARIKAAFTKNGGVIDQGADAQAYLRMRNAEGLTFDAKTVLLPDRPSTSAVFEEMIHTAQHRTGRLNAATDMYGTTKALDMMEIEAAEKLIRNRKAWGISNPETRQTIERLRALREAVK